MSEQDPKSPTRHDSVIEVLSDEEPAPPSSRRRHSVIEVPSDEESDSDGGVEIVSVTPIQNEDSHFTQIQTPHTIEYPGNPRRPVLPPRNTRNVRRRPNPDDMLFVHTNGRNLPIPALLHGHFPELLLEQQRALFRMFHSYAPSGEVSNSIMQRLDREDDSALDRRIENENVFNRKTLQKKKEIAEPPGYTNDISPEENLLCELCGVVLGEGIPSDFKPDRKYDDDLAKHAAEFRVNAPWFCIRQCFDTDVEMSKRVFAAKCGHVFCGRCIKNIANRPPGRRPKKQQLSVLNPLVAAPRKCPAHNCGVAFTKGKRTFTELFL